jgi:hypothetical protein
MASAVATIATATQTALLSNYRAELIIIKKILFQTPFQNYYSIKSSFFFFQKAVFYTEKDQYNNHMGN